MHSFSFLHIIAALGFPRRWRGKKTSPLAQSSWVDDERNKLKNFHKRKINTIRSLDGKEFFRKKKLLYKLLKKFENFYVKEFTEKLSDFVILLRKFCIWFVSVKACEMIPSVFRSVIELKWNSTHNFLSAKLANYLRESEIFSQVLFTYAEKFFFLLRSFDLEFILNCEIPTINR